jgi:hypothetical protein
MAAKKKTGNQNFVPLSKNDPRSKPTASVGGKGQKSSVLR